jgi:hypothetical protein
MQVAQLNQLIRRASFCVIVGVVMMFTGGGLARQSPGLLLLGGAACLGGWALVVWGCVDYMRWKGYSGWFGLFGYLLLPGLIILVCFPNLRKRMLQGQQSEVTPQIGAVLEEDQRAGYRFLLALVPLGVLFGLLACFLLRARSNIDAAEWKLVAPPGIGFQALMPGTARLQQQTQETPAGKVELYKFTVTPKGQKGSFMIVTLRFSEEVARQIGGPEKLLELGRKDVLASSQGMVRSEKQIVLGGSPGLELEVLPPKGAVIKAQIYATRNQIYEVSVYVSQIRLASEDVQKFFDSFKLSSGPTGVP